MKPHPDQNPDHFPPAFDRYARKWATGTTWTDFEAHLRLYGDKAPTEERTDLFNDHKGFKP